MPRPLGDRLIDSLGAKSGTGVFRVSLVAGTDAAADVTVTGMGVGDMLVSVLSFATAAAIATVADRTSEYQVQSGGLNKPAGTDDRNNQLLIIWLNLS